MQNASSKFLLKYLFIVVLALLIIFIKKQTQQIAVQNHYSLAFLNVNNHVIDSITNSLSIEEKINLLCSVNDFFVDSNDYNMITDTAFLKEYFQNHQNTNISKSIYYSYNIAGSKLADLLDSLFFTFIANRYQFTKQIFQKKALLTGLYYPEYLLKQISEIDDTAKYTHHFQYSFLQKKVDLHIFELTQNTELPNINYNGLSIIKLDSLTTITNDFVTNFLNTNFNIVDLSLEQKKVFQKTIKTLLKKNTGLQRKIDSKIKKILKARYWINKQKSKKIVQLADSLGIYKYKLKEKSIFIVQNAYSLLPLKNSNSTKYNIIWTSTIQEKTFLKMFKNYADYYFYKPKRNNENSFSKLNYTITKRINIIVVDDTMNDTSFSIHFNKFIKSCPNTKTIIVNFGNFDNLKNLPDSLTIVQMYAHSETDFSLAPQVLFGAINISSQTPYSLNKNIKFATINKLNISKLQYTTPEIAGIDTKKLAEIDKIAREGISRGAYPGCQIFVAKDGKVIYNKSFGYHTYSKRHRVKPDDVYDLASVTKIAATTIVTMKMISDGKISLDNKLGRFFNDTHIDYTRIKPDTIIKIDTFFTKTISDLTVFLKGKDTLNINDSAFVVIDTAIFKLTPKRNIFKVKLVDLLKHKSGILPVMPIFRYIYYRQKYFQQLIGSYKGYKKQLARIINYPQFEIPDSVITKLHLPDSLQLILNQQLKKIYFGYFSNKRVKDTSDIAVTGNLFLKNQYFDTIWNETKQLPVYSRKLKQYSDVNMILLQMALDSLNNMSINKYLKKNIFNPLGLKNISYLPLKYFAKNRIIPTENDNSWRYGLLQGYVHDPSSALLGGVAGNAGLYSNAHDLGVLFQMVLNGGTYGKNRYINSKVIKQFTHKFDDTQRALGFDMPNRKAIVGSKASKTTYGHSGYTGTCVWVDPETQLVYVFLSNRNYPSSKNWKIVNYHIRERIHNAIYDAIIGQK